MMKNQRQQHVEAWRQSGLSRSAYCRQHGLNKTTFARWVRGQAPTAARGVPGLIPLSVQEEEASSNAGPVVRLAGGARLELPAAVSPTWLAELLRCLG